MDGLRVLALLAATMACSPLVLADEAREGPWSGSVRFGYVAVGGNTDSETVNFRTRVNYDRNRWHHTFTASAVGASQDDQTTAEAYRASLNSQWDINPQVFVFGDLDYLKDKFSGFDQQISEVLGLGWRALKTDRQRLDLTIGAGARQSRLRDGSSDNEAVGKAGLDYTWQISETASFNQAGTAVSGSDNTRLESVTELSANIVGNLAMVLGYTLTRNTSVPAGSRNTDTLVDLALEWRF
ncbi:MAG: DUF481 domain-containing protein [Chromatiales bacterium]|nr:DUF481 domain-containing protein [Chromatiales bacterium]